MDCWVAQLGVVTDAAPWPIAQAPSLRTHQPARSGSRPTGCCATASSSPFIVDMENNGELLEHAGRSAPARTTSGARSRCTSTRRASSGASRRTSRSTSPSTRTAGSPARTTAADTAARWIPALYEARIFPIFLMWETDLFATLRNKLEDEVEGIAKPTAGVVERLQSWWNQRLERALARPGSVIWGEMKQNARAISESAKSGARILYQVAEEIEGLRAESRAASPDRPLGGRHRAQLRGQGPGGEGLELQERDVPGAGGDGGRVQGHGGPASPLGTRRAVHAVPPDGRAGGARPDLPPDRGLRALAPLPGLRVVRARRPDTHPRDAEVLRVGNGGAGSRARPICRRPRTELAEHDARGVRQRRPHAAERDHPDQGDPGGRRAGPRPRRARESGRPAPRRRQRRLLLQPCRAGSGASRRSRRW